MATTNPSSTPPGISRTLFTALFGTRVPRYVVLLIVVLAGLVVVQYGVSLFTRPWAHGDPALVGYWTGEMVFGPGDARRVALHLEEATGGSRGGTDKSDITGAAKVCGAKGKTDYRVRGKAGNRQGTQFRVGFGSGSPAPGPGKHPGEFHGTWDGEDALNLRTRLYTVGSDGVARATTSMSARQGTDSSADDVQFDLRRSNKNNFDAAC